MEKIKIGILGYGNLGKGVENAASQLDDIVVTKIYTRRNPRNFQRKEKQAPIVSADLLENGAEKDVFDVLVICGGSAKDLPWQTPKYAKHYHVVDSYDNHEKIWEHYRIVDESAKQTNHVAVIGAGWDPGLFSLQRSLADLLFPGEYSYTFWGKGVSQGHSDALRRIPGVKDGIQYTIPMEETFRRIQVGLGIETQNFKLTEKNIELPEKLFPWEMHRRECFVVCEQGADQEQIEKQIKEMEGYFKPYLTTVHFVSEEILHQHHKRMSHRGSVIAGGTTDVQQKNRAYFQFSMGMDTNPQLTAKVLLSYTRGAYRLSVRHDFGAKTPLDFSTMDLTIRSEEEMIKRFL